MATLEVRLRFVAAPVSTLQHRASKGIEQFYYVLLFTNDPRYSGSKIWRDWLRMGFHVAIKDAPPRTAAEDQIRVSVVAPSKEPRIIVEGSNEEYMGRLERLLKDLDSVRPSVAAMEDDAIVDWLTTGPVGAQLIAPLTENLQREGFRADEIDEFQEMIRRGLLALVHPDLKQMELLTAGA